MKHAIRIIAAACLLWTGYNIRDIVKLRSEINSTVQVQSITRVYRLAQYTYSITDSTLEVTAKQ